MIVGRDSFSVTDVKLGSVVRYAYSSWVYEKNDNILFVPLPFVRFMG